MSGTAKAIRVFSLLVIAGLASAGGRDVIAQQATSTPQPTAPGYVPRGTRPAKGLAPGMKVTDLGKSGHTYRVSMTKGDEMMSGLTEFAETVKKKGVEAMGRIPTLRSAWEPPGFPNPRPVRTSTGAGMRPRSLYPHPAKT